MDPIAEIYREYARQLKKITAKGQGSRVYNGISIDEEIAHMEAHALRLETNHKDCIKPCCPACTVGNPNKR